MENDTDTTDTPTILGNQLTGSPYSVPVMQQASLNLYCHSNGIAVNKLYVRLKPADYYQLMTLEKLDIDMYDYPLDYEVLQEGDYYQQPGVVPDEIPWYYAMVDVGFQPPAGIQYQIIQQVYIPEINLFLEKEAFRITGNNFEDNCVIEPSNPIPPCEQDPCFPECPDYNPDLCGGGGGGGGGQDVKKPAGVINVWDNRLNGGKKVPVRRIRVVARNFLKVERVYTNEIGRFNCNKQFKKATIVVKMKNNNTAVRGLWGWRLQNLVWPLKKNIGKYKGNLNNIDYTFFRQEAVKTRGMQDWVGVTVFNKRTDFDGLAQQDGLPGPPLHMNLFITTASGAASAPMFPHRYPNNNELLYFFVKRYLGIVILLPEFAAAINEIAKANVDVLYGYNRSLSDLDSDDISEVMFHELSHAKHYNKVGNNWWHEFVLSELTETSNNWNTQFDPYGQGNTVRSPIIALGESWAYHYGRILTDRVYGINFSSSQIDQGEFYDNGIPVAGLSSHLNLLEDFSPNRTVDPFRWIPQGIYYDLFDNRNDHNFNIILPVDNVQGYTNLQFFNALDNDITSLPEYRTRFLAENGFNQAVIDLFTEYHY